MISQHLYWNKLREEAILFITKCTTKNKRKRLVICTKYKMLRRRTSQDTKMNSIIIKRKKKYTNRKKTKIGKIKKKTEKKRTQIINRKLLNRLNKNT